LPIGKPPAGRRVLTTDGFGLGSQQRPGASIAVLGSSFDANGLPIRGRVLVGTRPADLSRGGVLTDDSPPQRVQAPRAMAISRSTRSSVLGCVLNKPRSPPPDSGFTIIIWAVSGCRSAASIGTPRA
jgi:hypothetical protein